MSEIDFDLATSLGEAIEWFVIDQFGICEHSRRVASAILAMPEMQAIATFILDVMPDYVGSDPSNMKTWMGRYGLPASVIEWVLS